jgi:CheY-like chemotaxis protein
MSLLSSKPCILYVEDDIEDVELLTFILGELSFDCRLVHAYDGIQAMDLLEQLKENNSLPDLVLLDINLSKLNGKEVLVCIKADKKLARIPVVILSTSNAGTDMSFFRRLNIPYIIKPGDIKVYKSEISEVLASLLPLPARQKSR